MMPLPPGGLEWLDLLFDGSLAAGILATAWLLLSSPGFARAVVLFITFGLLMSLAWVRMMAPDIALAEAAIGAGITGVLLMDALRHMEWKADEWKQHWPRRVGFAGKAEQALPTLVAVAMAGVLLAAVARLAPADPGMAARARENMEYLGHPVTAVLLVFRPLDTMLELGILLLALLGMLVARGRRGLATATSLPRPDPVLAALVRVLVPLAVLVAGYLLWLGSFAAGGAFQAGVVLGAAGVLLWLSGHRFLENSRSWLWHLLMMAGFVTFLAISVATLVPSEWALAYPLSWLPVLIQTMEITAAVSIGATLAALFVGLHPHRDIRTSRK